MTVDYLLTYTNTCIRLGHIKSQFRAQRFSFRFRIFQYLFKLFHESGRTFALRGPKCAHLNNKRSFRKQKYIYVYFNIITIFTVY